MVTIEGFCGPIGSGKTYQTLKKVESLKSNGNPVFVISWADVFKKEIEYNFGLTKKGKTNIDTISEETIYSSGYIKLVVRDICKTHQKKIWVYQDHEYFDVLWNKHGKKLVECIINAVKSEGSEYNHNYRSIMQIIGTEFGRGMDKDIWINATLFQIKEIISNTICDNVIIDDIRFFNEKELLEDFCLENEFRCNIWAVTAPKELRAERRGMSLEELERASQHGSETEIEAIQQTIPSKYHIVSV